MSVDRRPPEKESTLRMITVRVREVEYVAIRRAAWERQQSMNRWCAEALVRAAEARRE